MNRALCAALLLAAILAGTPSAPGALDKTRLLNRDYVRLADWARLRGFKLSRSPGSREVVATRTTTRIGFLIDASRAEVDNVGVWLSNPVILADGQVFVADQDARNVLDALVQPKSLPGGSRIRTICLDPGHGGKEPGQKAGTRLEKTHTLALAEEVRTRLIQRGFKVVMTRRKDAYVDHAERTAIAKRNDADLFISLHYNAAPSVNSEANGIEVYAMTPEGARSTNVSADVGSLRAWAGNATDHENVLLAYHLQRSLLQRLPGTEDRGVRRARFLVLRLAQMPAVLIEGGFMSNPSDARWIYSETGRKKMAQAIVDGIVAYQRQVERPAPVSQRNTSSSSSNKSTAPSAARN